MIHIKPAGGLFEKGIPIMKRRLIHVLAPAAGLLVAGCAALPPIKKAEPMPTQPPAPIQAAAPASPASKYPGSTGAKSGAATTNVSMASPMAEKRDALTATGYAVVSVQNHRLPAQQRLMAIRASKLDAYRGLTEQVYGQQLDARTTVADMVIQSDSFRTRVEGVIYGARLESITPIGDDTYETTLTLDGAVVNDLRLLYLEQLAAQRAR